jgi:two-component system, OmpR family, flagellar system response regulator FtcR
MIVIVDGRPGVEEGLVALFARIGIAAMAMGESDCAAWVAMAPEPEVMAAEAFLLGMCADRCTLSRTIRRRSAAALIAISEEKSLAETLELFEAGCDDVVRQPIHVREILARIRAIRLRSKGRDDVSMIGDLKIYFDGRDPEIGGVAVTLPRRERNILEYLAANKGCWISKSRVFNSVYGIFSSDVDETVVESHVSRLRKRLRDRLGCDPISTQRYAGYRLDTPARRPECGRARHHIQS